MVKKKPKIFINSLKWVLRAQRGIQRRTLSYQFMSRCFVPAIAGKGLHIIDIGAGSAEFCYLLRNRARSLWAIEPNPNRIAAIQSLNVRNLRALHCAVGDETAVVELKIPLGNANQSIDTMGFVAKNERSRSGRKEFETVKVRQIRLDQLIYLLDAGVTSTSLENDIEDPEELVNHEIIFIRLRSPGHEAEVLNGMQSFLQIYRPVIFWQFSEGVPDQQVSAFRSLCAQSYSCYKIRTSLKMTKVDVASIGNDEEGERIGYMFLHDKTDIAANLFDD